MLDGVLIGFVVIVGSISTWLVLSSPRRRRMDPLPVLLEREDDSTEEALF